MAHLNRFIGAFCYLLVLNRLCFRVPLFRSVIVHFSELYDSEILENFGITKWMWVLGPKASLSCLSYSMEP